MKYISYKVVERYKDFAGCYSAEELIKSLDPNNEKYELWWDRSGTGGEN